MDILDDTPFRNLQAACRILGDHVTIGGKWEPAELRALCRAGKIAFLRDKQTKRNSYYRLPNSAVMNIKNRPAHYEQILSTLPVMGKMNFVKPREWGEEWYTLHEVAGILGTSASYVYNKVKEGVIDSDVWVLEQHQRFYVGGKLVEMVYRVHRNHLRNFIKANFHGANGESV